MAIQEADFDPAVLQRELHAQDNSGGALVTFTGYVRGTNAHGNIREMMLEFYPGMTQRAISGIMAQASQRWDIRAATVVHRVGRLLPGHQIVWVGVCARHRADAFEACEFIMDYLKTQAPFWKKETGAAGTGWVAASEADTGRAQRWRQAAQQQQ